MDRSRYTDGILRHIATSAALLLALACACGQAPFHIARGDTVRLALSPEEESPVLCATAMLEDDLARTLSATVAHVDRAGGGTPLIVIETASQSFPPGSHQAFRLSVEPDGTLLVQGSDRLGTAFGTLDVSRRLGVSPWEWWAEAEIPALSGFTLSLPAPVEEMPYVEHRGIFINDEDWSLAPWASTFQRNAGDTLSAWKHSVGPGITERLCQLLLRLKADTYWPPMHETTRPFFLTEGNRQVAERYGIYIGTSHCEPMACNAAGEWAARGDGEYNFATNAEGVEAFWQERIDEVAHQPIIYTLGMRGVHDGAMQGAATAVERKELLQKVLATQREMLAATLGNGYGSAPQVFIPYKEVLEAVEAGLAIPDDVAVMQCDDNYGYIRWPADSMLARPAGTGLYYHASYWGRPHDYLWLSTTHPRLMQEELTRFALAGRQRLWILNVGDLKPAEYQTQLFMDIAWNPAPFVRKGAWREHLADFLSWNCGQSAPPDRVADLVRTLAQYYDLVFACRPEFLAGTRTEEADPKWKRAADLPWSPWRLTAYRDSLLALSDRVDTPAPTTAWMHLVQYPVQGTAQMAVKHVGATLARHGLAPWETSDRAHDSIQTLTARYNTGRWAGFMDASPRGLTVFQRAARDTLATPLPTDEPTLLDVSFADSLLTLAQGQQPAHITFSTDSIAVGRRLAVEVSVLPTHPRHGQRLALAVSLDGCAPVSLDFTTEGRSEEWKCNVLRNSAVRTATLPSGQGHGHTLTLTNLSGGEIFVLGVRIM